MNSNFDGGRGMYGAGAVERFGELGGLLNKPEPERREAGRSGKRAVLVLAVIATPVVLLLAGGLGFVAYRTRCARCVINRGG